MDYWRSRRYFGVTRHDRFLAIVLVESVPTTEPVVTTLPPVRSSDKGIGKSVEASSVLLAVQAGVQKANGIFHTHYHVTQIHYVEDDLPPKTVYEEMVCSLIEQIQIGADLREIQYKYADVGES